MIKAMWGAQPDPLTNYSAGDNPTTAGPRGGNFAMGAQSHALGSQSLEETQAHYAAVIPKAYQQAGVEQMQSNTHQRP